jgi:mono/diheme cytochrome c family protein
MSVQWRRAVSLLALAVVAGACRRGPPTPEAAYSRYCAKCHGADGRGDPRPIGPDPHLDLLKSEMLARHDASEVARRIREGHGRMPAFSTKLTSAEIQALAAFTIERHGPPAAAPIEGR